jgi:hypothetical protein
MNWGWSILHAPTTITNSARSNHYSPSIADALALFNG